MSHQSLFKTILFSRYRARALIIFSSLTATLFGLASPFFQKLFVDRLIGDQGSAFAASFAPEALIFIAFLATLCAQVFSQLSTYYAARESIYAQKDLGESLYEKSLSLKRDSRNLRPVGEIVSIYATDVPGATMLLEQTLPSGASIFFPLVLAPISIYWLYHVPLWSTLLTMGMVIIVNTTLSMRQSRFFYLYKQLAAERIGLVNEWVQNIRALRILGWIANFEARIFKKRQEETVNRVAMVTNGQTMNAIASCVTFFVNLSGVASLVYFQKRPVEPGELLALLWIFGVFLLRPFRQMPWFFVFLADAISSINRIESFLFLKEAGEEEEIQAMHMGVTTFTGTKGLAVKGLNLSIRGQHLLKDIDLEVQPGEFVAVVGEVGCGKSLLLLSLMRETSAAFDTYSFTSEKDSFEKNNLPDNALIMAAAHLRSHFGFVAQEGFVMSASLRDNIAFEYDTANVHDSLMTLKLERSQFDIRSESLTSGLATEIGERGVNLSGGQKQRIALARASYADRPILLLDDCLSAIDVDTEKRLVEDLFFSEWKNRTRILVTHRLSVLAHVDRVIFMHEGKISDQGRFDDLLARSDQFRSFTLSVNKENEDGDIKQIFH